MLPNHYTARVIARIAKLRPRTLIANLPLAPILLAAAVMLIASAVAATDPWRVVEQPDLKQALEQAPVLRTESLGEPARGVNVWERWFVPNPDGKSWDLLQIYFKELHRQRNGAGLVPRRRRPQDG
jgi:hypothetical protein